MDAQSTMETKTATFQADSALLRELGERLVGQAHIALAELVKNAYDADATRCSIEIGTDEIAVEDNGHGMSEREFLTHWMTIGTRHRQGNRGQSRNFGRNVTGSKGVGRLAAQFLAHNLEITTAAQESPSRQLVATVDWDEAIEAGNLTEALARYRLEPGSWVFPKGREHGTRVAMKGLKQVWGDEDLRDLGRELWMIQSPISRYGALATRKADADDFRVRLVSHSEGMEDVFDAQMQTALENYIAIITGEVTRRADRAEAFVQVSFRSGGRHSETFEVKPLIDNAKWEIRVFKLSGRQAGGIGVQTAREYFARFGGVKVYDARFRLPYYGVEQDWLGIEFDHSHRKNRSALLPDRLQVRRALNDLPTQGRLFGVVDIDTGREARRAPEKQRKTGDYLKIQVTRDRLVANDAYLELRKAVRWSLDYYATRQRLRAQERSVLVKPREAPGDVVGRVRSLVREARRAHPADETLGALEEEFDHLSNTIKKDREAEDATSALLGPLASAGMAALALEHETRKEMQRARQLLRRLNRAAEEIEDERIRRLTRDVGAWIERVEDARRLFTPLLDMDDREAVETLSARRVLERVVENVGALIPGMTVTVDVPQDLFLPAATFAEWSSLFQNLLVNAGNATLDSDNASACCVGGRTGRSTWIRIHDNGVGIDLEHAEELFEPFARRMSISETRRSLGLGGTGLGLTVVRMIAGRRNAKVSFIPPPSPWATTLQLSWSS